LAQKFGYVGSWQLVPSQNWPGAQALPQAPQFWSEFSGAHPFAQQPWPAPQVLPQALQFCVVPKVEQLPAQHTPLAQTRPQVPQLLGSFWVSRQWLPQQVALPPQGLFASQAAVQVPF